jgi:hypothetical protein
MDYPNTPQQCMYCEDTAHCSFLYREGSRYIPVCEEHELAARSDLRSVGIALPQRIAITRKVAAHDPVRNWSRDLPAPKFQEATDAELGRRVGAQRRASMNKEPPASPPYKRKTLLQRLGQDWKVLRGIRINDRIDLLVDGERYTVYTRGGG